MGKDQELLSAARNGNVTLIEKILSQRGKRSGPLASLRRGPGANIQDKAGYSALHYAALYGHTDCVRMLLSYEASPSLRDSRHSSPLHLAAWAGHQDIVKLLLTQSNRPVDPNLQTIDKATPLHCAALYGHTGALTTLLAYGADPNIIDDRGEKPLDLAAQYGHLQVVQMLVRAHPELLDPYKKHSDKCREHYDYRHQQFLKHSPLHSASRNGHRHVVEVLLRAGVDVNLVTSTGTALHEAALCGKESVVRILLEFGADLNVTDPERRTALDLLKQFPPNVTKSIISVIRDYQNSVALSGSEQEDILKVSHSIPSRGSFNDDQSFQSRTPRGSHAWSSYTLNDASSMLESPSSSVGSLDPASPRFRANDLGDSGNFYVTMVPLNPNAKVSPTPPKKPPRRNLSISPSTSKPLIAHRNNISGSSSAASGYDYVYLAKTGERKMPVNKAVSVDQCQNYVEMMSPAARQKHEAVLKQLNENLFKSAVNIDNDEGITFRSYNPNRKLRRIRDNYELCTNGSRINHGNSNNESGDDPMSPSHYKQPPTPEHPPPTARTAEKTILERIRPLSQEYRRSLAMYDYVARSGQNGTATFGGYENRNRLKNAKRQSTPQPSKQTQQQQQQPNHQHSASAINASHSLRARHRSSNYRDSSLSPCSSDVIMSHSLNASSGSLSSVSLSDRSESTDCVEYIADVPFAGLFKGSTMTLDNPNLITHGMSNSHSDYKYYQAMITEQQHKYYGAKDSQENRKQKSPQYQRLASNTIQTNRLERPKTLDTHLSTSPNQKTATLNTVQSAHNNSLPTTESRTTPTKEYDTYKTKLSINNDAPILPFDEQEEWNKISEIMANFGTDTDILHDSILFPNAKPSDKQSTEPKLQFANDVDTNSEKRNGSAAKQNIDLSATSNGPPINGGAQNHIRQFLSDNQLIELHDIFIDHGYDDIEFIKGILEENDLDTLGVKIELRQRLMCAINTDLQKPARAISTVTKSLPAAFDNMAINPIADGKQENTDEFTTNSNNNHINNNSNTNDNGNYNLTTKPNGQDQSNCNEMPSVDEWLTNIRLPQYGEVFRKHLYTDMDRISRIWEIELQAVLEINKIGHRKRMLYSVGAVPPKSDRIFDSKLIKFSNNGDSSKAGSSQRSSVSLSSHENSDPPCEYRPSRKNRQAPKPPIQKPCQTINDLAEQTTLEIRAPSELLLGVPPNLRTQWRHSAEILITGTVKYEVNYLGSTVVKELRGTESTRKSIEKLKRKEHTLGGSNANTTSLSKHSHHNTKRAVNILISYRGVQFVDPQTQVTICEHEIRNINCACQDADDLSHFAYITKDADNHYCHVFNVASMDLATEIILTLGQAFEVAYQIALRKSTPTTPIRSPAKMTLEK